MKKHLPLTRSSISLLVALVPFGCAGDDGDSTETTTDGSTTGMPTQPLPTGSMTTMPPTSTGSMTTPPAGGGDPPCLTPPCVNIDQGGGGATGAGATGAGATGAGATGAGATGAGATGAGATGAGATGAGATGAGATGAGATGAGATGAGATGAGATGAGATGAGATGATGAGMMGPEIPATMATLEQVIMSLGCAGADCHGGNEFNPLDLRLDDELLNNLTTTVSVKCENLPVVDPGNPEGSALVKLLKGPCGEIQRMPAGCFENEFENNCVPDNYIAAIEQWIADGALPE